VFVFRLLLMGSLNVVAGANYSVNGWG